MIEVFWEKGNIKILLKLMDYDSWISASVYKKS